MKREKTRYIGNNNAKNNLMMLSSLSQLPRQVFQLDKIVEFLIKKGRIKTKATYFANFDQLKSF